MVEYHRRPNQKKLAKFRETCAQQNINFDQIFSKAKEIQMKEKASQQKENPANTEQKVFNRL